MSISSPSPPPRRPEGSSRVAALVVATGLLALAMVAWIVWEAYATGTADHSTTNGAPSHGTLRVSTPPPAIHAAHAAHTTPVSTPRLCEVPPSSSPLGLPSPSGFPSPPGV